MLAALLLTALLGGAARAQAELPIHVTSLGNQYGFPDEADPDRLVWVFLGGVEVRQGERLMLARRMVLVLRADEGEDAPDTRGAGFVVPGSRVLEIFLEGDVSLDEGNERVVGADSLHIDNQRGTLSLERGVWRSKTSREPLYVHFESMRRLADGTRELRGVRATTCSSCDPDWSLVTERATLQQTLDGEVLHTAGNTVEVGGFPVFWLPGVHLNVDKDRPPLRRVELGSSRRFGTEVTTIWGGDADEVMTRIGEAFGVEGPVNGEWGFTLANYTDRGVFYEPAWEYETEDSKGRLFGAYIRDRAERDFLPLTDQDIDDKSRGRVDLEHRTRLDEQRVVDLELTYLSDSGFLREYYENESRIGKEQESYVSYRDVEDNQALSVLMRARLNDYDTQVEYLPRVEWRETGRVVDAGWFGRPVFSAVSFVDAVRFAPGEDPTSPDPQVDSRRNTRAGSRGGLTWPFDLDNGDRVQLTAGYDVTAFENSVDTPDDPSVAADTTVEGGSDLRYALTGGAEWSRTYAGTGEARSDTWNIDGVRQIVEPHAGFMSVFELNRRPPELLAIDETEALDKEQVFSVGVRHRIQTHQRDDVATILDTDVSMLFYPNEDRDNPAVDFTPPDGDGDPTTVGPPVVQDFGRTSGTMLVDTRWTPGADIPGLSDAQLRWRSRIDPDGWEYITSFLSYETAIGEGKRFAVSENKARHASNFVSAGVEWVLTQRWSAAVFFERDQRERESARRGILIRQRAECWIMDLELSRRRGTDRQTVGGTTTDQDREESRFALRFWPRLGGRVEQESLLQTLGRVR